MAEPIRIYGDPVLRKKAERIDPGDPRLAELIPRMFVSMRAAEGLGLAAPQIGESVRVAVIDGRGTPDGEDLVLINPEIISAWGEQSREEGCLSLPEIWIKVKRSAHVKLKYQDTTGNDHEMRASELLATAFQHEIDHLDGILIIDRISAFQRKLVSGKLRNLKSHREV